MAQGKKGGNGFAIASLICGILGCTGIGGLLAIIFGILGINKASRQPEVGGKGMAIAGIVLGAVMFLMACPMSILLPSLNRARETANRVKCASNLRSIGQAIHMYAAQNSGQLPTNLRQLGPTLNQTTVMVCPSTDDSAASDWATMQSPGSLSYVYLYEGRGGGCGTFGRLGRRRWCTSRSRTMMVRG